MNLRLKLPIEVEIVFGQTEFLWTIAMSNCSDEEESATPPLQPLFTYRYKVINEEGDEVEGEGSRSGQLAVTGPALMQKYICRDADADAVEETRRRTIRGTWLYSGAEFTLEGAEDELTLEYSKRLDNRTVAKAEIKLDPVPVAKADADAADDSAAPEAAEAAAAPAANDDSDDDSDASAA